MKAEIDSGELYPALFVTFPDVDWYREADAIEIPDELALRYKSARDTFRAAEEALLAHLKETGQAMPRGFE